MISIGITSLLAAATMAKSIAIAYRDADCTAISSGTLSANISGGLHPFMLNTNDQVSYTGSTSMPLSVQFQECQSLEVGLPHDTSKSGRIYVPSHDKCIAITNQPNAVGPYYTALATCNTEYPQRWVLRTDMNNIIFWSGDSDEEGTILQGGCGLLGYRSDSNGVPIHTLSNNQITIECDNDTPFAIASN